STTNVNGTTVLGTTYAYTLVATKEGTFTITAAALVVNGHTLLSNQLKIKVEGQAPPQQKNQQVQAPPADNNPAPTAKDIGKSLFIRADASKTKVYTGEEINVRYRLYT